jgi:feruloyl esterase
LAFAIVITSAPAALAQPALSPGAQAAALLPLPDRPIVKPVMDCAALAGHDFSHAAGEPFRIVSTAVEPASAGRAEMCVVKGYVTPQVDFELRLPTQGYAGRYLQGGCGGMCGIISPHMTPSCDDRQAFSGAFAVAFEDSGHRAAGMFDGVWAAGSPDLRTDFAYRATHVSAVADKAIIAAYYGAPPAYAYFQGCSDGGREALMEAQRYPDDFNGIVVGSSVSMPAVMIRFLWEAKYGLGAEGHEIMSPAAAGVLHQAALGACDALDGLKDGQIDDPRLCRFDPGVTACGPAKSPPDCLTPAQVEMARKFYQGAVAPDGVALYPGGEAPGSELSWVGPNGIPATGRFAAEAFFKYVLFPGELPNDFSARDWTFDTASAKRVYARGAVFDASDPDLRPFRDRGGKMILWQGAADQAAGVYGMLDYYQAVRGRVGGLDAARGFARMFVVPGVYHCGGGYVPYEEDFLGAVVNWTERGQAPDQVIATAVLPDSQVRRRPVFAYPVRARYAGGDVNDAASFKGVAPAAAPNDAYAWAGEFPSSK